MTSTQKEVCFQYRETFDLSDLELEHPSATVLEEMETHFERCGDCQKWLADWQIITLGTRELKQREVPSQILTSVMDKLDTPSTTVTLRSDTILAVASVAAFLLSAIFMGMDSYEEIASWFMCIALLVLVYGATHFTHPRTAT